MTYRNHPDWLLLLGLSAVLVLQACDGARQESKPSEAKAVPVTILALHAVPLEQIYEAAGAVRARQRAVLASKLQATVLSVAVKLGDAVRPGQLLMELDHSEADAEYARRAQEALASVCRPDYPQGMILWLGEASPRLYAELTERLPGEIHRLWSEHAPLEKFQAILDRWKQTHAQACVLYRAHLAARKPGEAKGRLQ